MRGVLTAAIALLIVYLIIRIRSMEEKSAAMRRVLDSRTTDSDIDHIVQLAQRHTHNVMTQYVDEKVHALSVTMHEHAACSSRSERISETLSETCAISVQTDDEGEATSKSTSPAAGGA